jgi:hypothetical protein
MTKVGLVVGVMLLCFYAFILEHNHATRAARADLLSTIKANAIWRESDWQASSIHYSRIIRAIEAGKTSAAIDYACREIARNEKRILQVQGIIDEADPGRRAPVIRVTHASVCEGRTPAR